ncbi:MAG: GNAT family N-acetyltransferase [Deltaproteobacteria bacterium]|nr:GNAT family N-acetyltransferase [Deltaproteobacteria bacterium]
MRIRQAKPSDQNALIELERQTPLDMGESSLFFDHSPDFFAQTRLQEHPRVLVAEESGELIAFVCGAWYETMLRDQRLRILYVYRGRVPPQRQRSGLGSAMAGALIQRCQRFGVRSAYWLISPDNKRSMAFGHRNGGVADLAGMVGLMSLSVDKGKTPTRLRRVGRDEIKSVTALLNRTHAHQELFLPYTSARLNRRLSRSADYSWDFLYGMDDQGDLAAVVGLWDQGRHARFTSVDRSSGSYHTESRAVVADYGYKSGAEELFCDLLREATGLSAGWGRSELLVTVPPDSFLLDRLSDLNPHILPLCFLLAGEARGKVGPEIWLDPVYL